MEQNDFSPLTARFPSPVTITRRRKQPVDPVIFIIVLSVLVLLLLFFFLHPLLSHIPKSIKPTSFKSTWDSLIFFLVFFAILCGVIATANDYAASTADATIPTNSIMPGSSENYINGGLRRSSRSYPDLRKESESLRKNGENRLRVPDNYEADLQYRSSEKNRSRRIEGGNEYIYRSNTVSGDIRHHPRRSEAEKVYVEGSTELNRHVPESKVQLGPLSPPAPAPPLPPKSRRRRTSPSLGQNETVDVTNRIDKLQQVSPNPPPPLVPSENRLYQKQDKLDGKLSEATTVDATSRIDKVKKVSNNPTPPPISPSPPAPLEHRSHQKHNKLDRNVSESPTKLATKTDSLDDQKKRKRKTKQKSIDIQPIAPTIKPPAPPTPPPPSIIKERVQEDSKSIPSIAPPEMPPPPPSPKSIFTAIFKSGSKSKRFPSITTPPLPATSIITGLFKTGKKSKQVNHSSAASSSLPSTVPVTVKGESKHKSRIQPPSPPSQTKPEPLRRRPSGTDKPPLPTKSNNSYDHDDSSSLSPLIPSKMPTVKFELRESVDLPSTTMDGEDSIGPSPVSFPSPDVNAKADSFISKRKDEWRKENLNLSKRKRGPPPDLINKPKMNI